MIVYPQNTLITDHRGDFASLEADWSQLLRATLGAHHIFTTPDWDRAWWQHLGRGEPHLLSVRQSRHLAGIMPLLKQGKTLTLWGDKEVCDYLDFVALPGEEDRVAQALLDFAQEAGGLLDLYPVLPDSLVANHLIPLAQQRQYPVHQEALDVSYMLELPASWEAYLEQLEGKHRHELRRKLRRLERAGQVNFYTSQSFPRDMDDFLHLFRISRADKSAFLTPPREAFFRQMAEALAQRGWLRLYFLELDKKRVATCLCFQYGSVLYLYNSGFDPAYAHLAVGLLSKALTIRQAIEQGSKRYDFLRGAEDYKSHLGGQPTPVYRYVVRLRRTQPGSSVPPLEEAT